jgi:glycosyltransferase involved in cell wall biosynthesis
LQQLRPTASIHLLTLLDQPSRMPRMRLVLRALAFGSRVRPQLVICTHLHLAPLAWLTARLAGARLWVVAHGIEVWGTLGGTRRWALLRANQLLPVSRFTAASLREQLGSQAPTLHVLANTYNADAFSPGERPQGLLERYKLQAHQPLIFSLTRLSKGDQAKHIDRLILAMADLQHSHPTAVLLIGGDGDDRPRLQALVEQHRLNHCVLLPGRLDDHELVDHYRLATVFALPSEKEGFGIVFLEALACGLPVLAGHRDGSVDPLADGRFGLLVDPRRSLVEPLKQLLDRRGDPLWFNPAALSAAVAERFAFPAYCKALEQLLEAESRLCNSQNTRCRSSACSL